ncbi:YeeE/YedE thiosulfate transporter family protein [Methanoregula sp.]|uniref:YeeE/YedE thiosulfate transporter family protein n=1 Tax=Methanoregula sp. TaxID=2052170 RepID=UPI002627A671|nr:YeeE/YedE thiosulfate transporter family protein [Methanoregula sp.]MDD5143529.1 YeeE/YedE thiosulfate transporter family protein [Methanoregula sp.]
MTLETIRKNGIVQAALGLLTGIAFGFLLQKAGVTDYDVIIGQLLLTDFTVVKVMLAAVLVGMIGVFALKSAGIARLHCRSGSIGSTVVGGLIFGAGFALLGYCPGTAAGAVGTGALDALAGVVGIAIGAGIFARLYPVLNSTIMHRGAFPADTVPELLGVRPVYVATCVAVMILTLFWLFQVWGI